MLRVAIASACLLVTAACGSSAETGPPAAPPSSVNLAAPPTQQAAPGFAFTGDVDGRPFEAAFAGIGWQWPSGWTLYLSDRPPGSDGRFTEEATVVEVSLGNGVSVESTNGQPREANRIGVQLPSTEGGQRAYEGMATGRWSATSVETSADDPSGSYPQGIGRADVRVAVELPAAGDVAAGRVEGQGTVPVAFIEAPHRTCRELADPPADVEWSERPDLRAAPDAPLHGNLRGHGFTPASTYFLRTGDEWRLIVTTASEPGSHPGVEEETAHVRLDRAPRRGRQTRAMAPGGGHVQLCDGLGTTSWNGDNAYALELTRWSVGRCTPAEAGGPSQLGTASGRVVVTYRGFDESDQSWVAGAFEDVPVLAESCE